MFLLPLLLVHCQDGVACAKTFAHSFTVFESVIYSLFITDLLCVSVVYVNACSYTSTMFQILFQKFLSEFSPKALFQKGFSPTENHEATVWCTRSVLAAHFRQLHIVSIVTPL